MNTTKEMYIRQMGIDEKVYDYSQTLLENLKERFAKIDETAEYNQMKVVAAMQKNHVAEMHLNGTTGYGYNDDGRDTLEQVMLMSSTRKRRLSVLRLCAVHTH